MAPNTHRIWLALIFIPFPHHELIIATNNFRRTAIVWMYDLYGKRLQKCTYLSIQIRMTETRATTPAATPAATTSV